MRFGLGILITKKLFEDVPLRSLIRRNQSITGIRCCSFFIIIIGRSAATDAALLFLTAWQDGRSFVHSTLLARRLVLLNFCDSLLVSIALLSYLSTLRDYAKTERPKRSDDKRINI